MRDNSGGGKSENNNRNPTLRDAEAAKGRSGEAVHGGKGDSPEPGRQSVRRNSP